VRARPELEDGWLVLGRAWVRLARESRDAGYYLHAEECAKALLERAPSHAGGLNLLGLVELNRHDFASAKETAEQIVARDARDVLAWGTLSDAELELGDFEAAVGAAERMMREKPGLPAYTRTAYLRWLRGDVPGAVEAIRLAIDAGDPRDPEPLAWTLVQAALFFWHGGDVFGADAGFDMALQVSSDYPAALTGKARVALARGDAASAVELLRRAERQSPGVETLWLLGDALAAAGDRSGSERALAAAERAGLRGDPRALSLMDATRNQNLPRALELARAERKKRADIYTEDALAWALYRSGDLAAAKASSERACRLGTRDAQLWFHRGAILLASGAASEGRALLRQALALNPHFDPTGAAEARRLLETQP
jgi:tetratricopeptide (TPR) repeat protein